MSQCGGCVGAPVIQVFICLLFCFEGHMWDYVRSPNMAANSVCRVCGDGCDAHPQPLPSV